MFDLHPTLKADTVELTRWDVCRVLLMKDANYPWLILVPERQGLSGLQQLADTDRPVVMEEINHASRAMQELYDPVRINVAALGNVVEQLHIHVIARFDDDPAWPGPVWGVKPRLDYDPEVLVETVETLRTVLELN